MNLAATALLDKTLGPKFYLLFQNHILSLLFLKKKKNSSNYIVMRLLNYPRTEVSLGWEIYSNLGRVGVLFNFNPFEFYSIWLLLLTSGGQFLLCKYLKGKSLS